MNFPKHFLITRFNLRMNSDQPMVKEDSVMSEDWLAHRFALFENYCLPSVVNQNNKNFRWLIFFDLYTPEEYVLRIERITKKYDFIKTIFIDGMKVFHSSLKAVIIENSKFDDLIITTRLDNDDIIHRNFIDTIQTTFPSEHNTVIDLQNGYQMLLTNKKIRIKEDVFYGNQFISYVEKVSANIQTVMSREHREWRRHENYLHYKEKRLWIEVVHSKNLVNTMRNNGKRLSSLKSSDFGLSEEHLIQDKSISVYTENFLYHVQLLLRKVKRKLNHFL